MSQFDIKTTDNGKYLVETYEENIFPNGVRQTLVFDSLQEVLEAADEFFPSDDGEVASG